MLLRWSLRELARSWRLSLFFVLNLSLGLTGFIALEAYKNALQSHIQENRKNILGADLAVSVRREFSEEEEKSVREALGDAPETLLYDFFAMISVGETSRLVLVKAIDENYPLYGGLTLEDGSRLTARTGSLWIYPELKAQLGVEVGKNLKLGNLDLTIQGVITGDTTQTFRSAGIAPRVFIHRDDLPASGLIQFGSTFTKSWLFRLEQDKDAEVIRDRLFQDIKDSAVRVETAAEEAEDSGRQLSFLSDYLGLVALVALFLAGLGASYIWRLFLQQRVKDVAILRSLGLGSTQAVALYVLQALMLGAIALVPALIAAQILFPLLNSLLSLLTPFALQPLLSASAVGVGLLLSVGTSLLVALPFLLKLREVKPAQLFSEHQFSPDLDLRRPWAFLPAVAALWGLAVWQAKSFMIGSLFLGTLAGVLVSLSLIGWGLLSVFRNWKLGTWDLRFGLKGAGRRTSSSLAVFVALGLGCLLMNLLPQIKASLQQEFQVEGPSKIPSLFMFDIQDEQVEPLKKALADRQLDLAHLSPMIRSRIVKVNGENFERKVDENTGFKTREEEREVRFRNRGVNLSSRATLSDSEVLLSGREFSGTWDPESNRPAEISLEKRYADRLGLQIGDRMLFDVQGVEFEGEVINFRQVRWTSFQPNFFVLVQPGVLDDAPKIWIAGVAKLPEDMKISLQNEFAKLFPNVSVIDVARTVNDVLKVAEQMSWSLELMAALALLTGGIVLFSIVRSQVRGRRWELNLLKILGAGPLRVNRYLLSEFVSLVALSAIAGSFLSAVVGPLFLWQIFGLQPAFDLWTPLLTSLFVTLMGAFVAWRASQSVVKEKPLSLLREP